MAKSKDHRIELLQALRDPAEAAEYLAAALQEQDREGFLLALRNVAEAQGGIGRLAERANLNRETLYRTLSEEGNPELRSLEAILRALGLRLSVEVEDRREAEKT